MRLSDSIESFIKDMLDDGSAEVELKRNELAEYFRCAPSQINYVLATRFSPEVQSGSQRLMYLVNERIGDSLTGEECIRLISQLKDAEIVTAEEASLMAAAVSSRALSVPLTDELKNAMRARIMKSMLMTIAARNKG